MSGDDLREWAASAFDPATLRVFSLLPDEDADDAYCTRHDRDMRAVDPIVHTDGALYTTAKGFSVYTCPKCVAALDDRGDRDGHRCAGVKLYRRHLSDAFDRWDAGDAPGEWFGYIGEGTVEDIDGGARFIAFESAGTDGPD
jgi:hypothetical protein